MTQIQEATCAASFVYAIDQQVLNVKVAVTELSGSPKISREFVCAFSCKTKQKQKDFWLLIFSLPLIPA